MKKILLIFSFLILLGILPISRPQSAMAVDCPTFLGTDPALPKEEENITLKFSSPSPTQSFQILVGGSYICTLGLGGNCSGNPTRAEIGTRSSGEYELKIFPHTIPPTNEECAKRWFLVKARNAVCTNQRVGNPVNSCSLCSGSGLDPDCCQRNPAYGPPDNLDPSAVYFCYTSTRRQPSPGPVFQPTYCVPNDPQSGIQTALGCIPTANTTQFIAWILKFAIGIGGGIAFILMLIGVFQIITSSGDPERLKAGKELITSALIGLLMIIFSLFLLKLIGVDILQIPGFGPQNPGGGGGGTGKNLLM